MASKDPYTFANQAAIPPTILKPILNLFRWWDMQNSDDSYLSEFASDATLMFGPEPSKGREAIQARRESMLHPTRGPIVNSEHQLGNMFLLAGRNDFIKGRQEILMNGTIWYLLKNGTRVDADWGSRAVLDGHDGDLKISSYQVYIDPTELLSAITKMIAANS